MEIHDLISLLAKEHGGIRLLLSDVQAALDGEARTPAAWRDLFRRIAAELHVHFALEEHELYGPLMQDETFGQQAADRVTEHGRARILLARVRERFLAPDPDGMRRELRDWLKGMRAHLEREEALFRELRAGRS